jgi:hypothetical protein
LNTYELRDDRRLDILEGLNQGLSHERIAEKIGIHPRVLRKDLNIMRYRKDPELKKAQKNAKTKALEEKEKMRDGAGERFIRITGMTFEEKTFHNMMRFYLPEIKKIIRSKRQDIAIRKLPGSVVKTLKKNGIIAFGRKQHHVTKKARNYLQNNLMIKI